ncbi:MAG: DUF6125 family protein [Candidatus Helarchaeales archaeon]
MVSEELRKLSKDELLQFIENLSKRWLAHDGLWFQAAEKRFGLDVAMDLDRDAWREFTVIEARRIMEFLNMKPGGGIPALKKALKFRLYANLNIQSIVDVDENSFIFQMNTCRVQAARKRKGLPDFPCKSVAIVEYTYFAKTIDPRFEIECVGCPPDERKGDFDCAWKFTLKE